MNRIWKSGLARSAASLVIGLFLVVQSATAYPGENELGHAPVPAPTIHSHGDPATHEGHAAHPGNSTDSGMTEPGTAWPTPEAAGAHQGESERDCSHGSAPGIPPSFIFRSHCP